ncbi:hypothetical protein AX14_010876 [Amanita brunnescens Koide BX004]|nr:hypothetical protein AX14_010876 [Amanita brunnescens Koide BX004]
MTLFSASEMIRLCPQLEKFTVNFSLEYADVDSHIPREPTSIVENHRLRRLSIRVEEDCSPFLHSLTLPSLTQFDCSFFNDLNDEMLPFTHQALLEFLTRSKCKLQKLKLGDCKLSAPAFLECLAHETLETIQSLDISHHPKLTDDILIHLTDLPTSPRVLLPKLTHLELEMCLAARRGMLGKMVFSRCCSPGHEAERILKMRLQQDLTHLLMSNLNRDPRGIVGL